MTLTYINKSQREVFFNLITTMPQKHPNGYKSFEYNSLQQADFLVPVKLL